MLRNNPLFKSKSNQETSNQKSSEKSQNNLENNDQFVFASEQNQLAADAVSEAEPEEGKSLKVDVPPEELAKFQALRSKMVSASFGEMVTLLMKSPHYRHYSLADLDWLLIPPLMTNQFLVVEAQLKPPAKDKDTEGEETKQKTLPPGVRIPVGLALWAKVSPEVDAKLSENLNAPVKLRPDEWRSGEINWLIEVIGDQQIMAGLYNKLKSDVFKGQKFKVRAQDKDGKHLVQEVSGEAMSDDASTGQDATPSAN